MAFGEIVQSLTQIGANYFGVVLKRIALDDLQHGKANRGGNWVAAKGIEVSGAAELLDQRGPHREACHRMSRPHRFTHRHDVRYDPVTFEAPHPIAGAREPRLDFIGDEYAPHCADL